MTRYRGDKYDAPEAWYEPVLELIQPGGVSAPGAGSGGTELAGTHPDGGCEVCDENDHCLPRWEDDGGGTGWRPSPAPNFEEGSERDRGRHDQPCEAQGRQPA